MTGLGYPELPTTMAIAVSGGADSMALTYLAARWARQQGIELIGLTVDHRLRPESGHEVKQVCAWLADAAIAIPCHILTPTTPLDGSNIQEKARKLRYGLMRDWCCEQGIGHLLLAHHADDQLETVLMRLIRASGVEGLAAMRPVSDYQGLTLLRPLLPVPKAHLIATLRAAGQAWLEDPTNQSDMYLRNRLRPVAAMLQDEGLSPERVTLLTRQLAHTASYLAEETQAWLAWHATEHETGYSLSIQAWQEVPKEIGWRALRQLLHRVGGAEKPVRSEKLMLLLDALQAGELTKPRTLAGCLLRPDVKKGIIYLEAEA